MESSKGSILIVDDNPTNLNVLFDCLNEAGFQTLVALNGKDALNRADYAQPDIILLDVMMPGMDGFETCRQLKQIKSTIEIPVIFMTALSDTNDKIEGFNCGAVDYICKPFQQEEVLARINAHMTIRQQKKELAELNATKDKFFSIISHDVRNQFNLLVGYSGMLHNQYDEYGDEEKKDFIREIAEASNRTYKLFENLAHWAKMQRHGMTFTPETVDLNAVISKIVSSLGPDARQKKINLSAEISKDNIVQADKNMTELIIRNLITNAIKFTCHDGNIKITNRTAKDYMEIIVADTGVGMSPERVANLFKLDVNQSTPGTDEEKGTGLGLILCKEFTQRHGGKIWAESDLGKGSKFTFTLPRFSSCKI
ncbi:Two component system response regulator histidine kinase [Desulfonema limicola]|uniref:histidine kinase n=1 Tax=Desulfonema limicola TaxID=45656 RepID=A0A975B3G3_9BACT|nr:hybrid sensor histidine kinase/response regulator [Desulfonema limicola]QTA78097.1 Two component system response regulator histidine kinase [Desulfonema limicola]